MSLKKEIIKVSGNDWHAHQENTVELLDPDEYIKDIRIDSENFNRIPKIVILPSKVIISFRHYLNNECSSVCPDNEFTDYYRKQGKIGYFLYTLILNILSMKLHSIFGGCARDIFTNSDSNSSGTKKIFDIDLQGTNMHLYTIMRKDLDNNRNYWTRPNYDLIIRILYKIIFKKSIMKSDFYFYKTIINKEYNNICLYYETAEFILKLDLNNLPIKKNDFFLKPNTIQLHSDFIQNQLYIYFDRNGKCNFKVPQITNNSQDTLNKLAAPESIINKLCSNKNKSIPWGISKIIISFLLPEEIYFYQICFTINRKIMITSHDSCKNISKFMYYKIVERWQKFVNRKYKMCITECACKFCIWRPIKAFIDYKKTPIFFQVDLYTFLKSYYYQNGIYDELLFNHLIKSNNNIHTIRAPSMIYGYYSDDYNLVANSATRCICEGNHTIQHSRDSKKYNEFEFNFKKRSKKKSKSEFLKFNKTKIN